MKKYRGRQKSEFKPRVPKVRDGKMFNCIVCGVELEFCLCSSFSFYPAVYSKHYDGIRKVEADYNGSSNVNDKTDFENLFIHTKKELT